MVAGFNVERYRYVSRLGSGGSSTVVLAEDTLLGRRVALKQVHASDDVAARSRLRREALIGASLSHPNLVSIFDVATTEEGEDVIVMEYVEGETLAHALRRGAKPDVPTALEVLDGVGAALDAIHARRIVHRDVKPGNILLGEDGSVKLADLGIAAVPDRTKITTAGSVLGTVSYMAPEQLEGTVATRAVDIYALAAVAFEVLSGVKAHREPNALALAHAIATRPPPDLRTVWPQAPPAAAEVLIRAMSRDPRQRPRSAGDLTRRLRQAVEHQPTVAVAAASQPASRPRRWAPVPTGTASRRSRARVLAAAASLLTAAAVAAIVLANAGSSHQRAASHRTTQSASRPATHSTAGHPRAHVSAAATAASGPTPGAASKPAASTPAASPAPASSLPAPASPVAAAASPSAASASLPASPGSPASPVSAVEAFYRLAASHQYAAAWALTDPSFRQQLAGYQGLEATMSAERSIVFTQAGVLNQSPASATVSVHTTSVKETGTQNCSGTVNLLRAGTGSPGWLLDHIAISCV